MKVSSIDIDVFQDAPDDIWFSAGTISDEFHGVAARLKRMTALGLLEQRPPPSENFFKKRPVDATCSKCNWVGTEAEMDRIPDPRYRGIGVTHSACPKCGCNSYYRLT